MGAEVQVSFDSASDLIGLVLVILTIFLIVLSIDAALSLRKLIAVLSEG